MRARRYLGVSPRPPGLRDLKECSARILGKRCLFCYTLLGKGKNIVCNKAACMREYDNAVHRDYRADVYQTLTPVEKRKLNHGTD